MSYFLDTDDSAHWYVVPDDKRDAWDEWRELDDDDPRGWDEPEWANRIGGHPRWVVFPSYEER